MREVQFVEPDELSVAKKLDKKFAWDRNQAH